MIEPKDRAAPTTVLEALRAARRILTSADSWAQNPIANPRCKCLYGAIRLAVANPEPGVRHAFCLNSIEALLAKQCANLLVEQLGKRIWSDSAFELERWNDTPGRKHEDVLWLLDRAIAALETSAAVL